MVTSNLPATRRTLLSMLLVVVLTSAFSVSLNIGKVSAARCFSDGNAPGNTDPSKQWVQKDPPAWCNYDTWKDDPSIDLSQVPNPFPAGDDTCIYFHDGVATVVNCEDPKFINATEYGQTPGGESSSPPPPALELEETGAVDSGSDELNVWLNRIIDALTGITGLIIVISLIFAGIQYMTARDNASQVSAAKNRIVMTILAFALYMMGAALLQWIVPGGVF